MAKSSMPICLPMEAAILDLLATCRSRLLIREDNLILVSTNPPSQAHTHQSIQAQSILVFCNLWQSSNQQPIHIIFHPQYHHSFILKSNLEYCSPLVKDCCWVQVVPSLLESYSIHEENKSVFCQASRFQHHQYWQSTWSSTFFTTELKGWSSSRYR